MLIDGRKAKSILSHKANSVFLYEDEFAQKCLFKIWEKSAASSDLSSPPH